MIIDEADAIQRHTTVVEHDRSTTTSKGIPWSISATANQGEITDRDVRTVDNGQQPEHTTPLNSRSIAINDQVGT